MEQLRSVLEQLARRFDPDVLDLPLRGGVIRAAEPGGGAFDVVLKRDRAHVAEAGDRPAEAELSADLATWRAIAADPAEGMTAYRHGRLRVRRNLHLGVGFLAATSGDQRSERLRLRRVRTDLGTLSTLEAGAGPPVVMLHGLGGTKVSFMPTVRALAATHRVIAADLPGFGDSDKPLGAYDAPFFAAWVKALLDALDLERTHLVGHSLGGRVALETAFRHPGRIERLVLMTPSLAWLRDRPWAPMLRLVRPELGLLQPAPRQLTEAIVRRMIPGADGGGWATAGVDEFLRAYTTPRGRLAFYAAARNIYLEDPQRFWAELETLAPESLFIWGTRDPLVPVSFRKHVERRLQAARHVELDCGHVPQVERPRQLNAAIAGFLDGVGGRAGRAA